MIPLSHILILGALLFAVGVTGIFLNRKNMLRLLMCIELMLLAVNMNFIAFDYYAVGSLGNGGNEGDGILHGQVFVFFILTVAAAEAAIGLAILVALFRNRKSIDVQVLDKLKG